MVENTIDREEGRRKNIVINAEIMDIVRKYVFLGCL